MTEVDGVERGGDKIDVGWGSRYGVLAGRAVGAGSPQVEIRHFETARPSRHSVLHRGRGLLDVEVAGLDLPASIRLRDLGGWEVHNLGPHADGSSGAFLLRCTPDQFSTGVAAPPPHRHPY